MPNEKRWRAAIWLATVALVGILVWPASWSKGRDSFPLSPYPMFARRKTSPNLELVYAVAFDGEGKRHYVAPEFVGSSEVLQARAILARAASQRQAPALCREILQRLLADEREVAELHILRGYHNAVHLLQADEGALPADSREKKLARCQP